MAEIQKYEDVAESILNDIMAESIELFKAAIDKNGAILTGALKKSWQAHIVKSAEMVALEIEFLEQGRFKDIKTITYDGPVANIDAMVEFVEKVGIDEFSYVPGYKTSQQPPTITNAIKRIATGIAFGMLRRKTVKRKYDSSIYNTPKMDLVNLIKSNMSARSGEWIARHLVNEFENA